MSRRLHIMLTTALASVLFASCEPETTNKRNRPSNEGEAVTGYLDSTEKDVSIDQETTIVIGNTEVLIPSASAQAAYRVRLSRREAVPDLTTAESTMLGNPKSDVVDVELYNPSTNEVLSSDDLVASYMFSQSFTTAESTSNIGLYIVTDSGTSTERRTLVPNSELKIENVSGLRLTTATTIRISVQLKLTKATLWLVAYTDDALKELDVSKADAVNSIGGSSVQNVTPRRSASITDAAISINSGASYTSSTAVSLSLSANGAAEMYITPTAGCSTDGSWENFAANKAWNLSTLNAVSRVYVRFKAGDGSQSSCLSSSIIHDDIPPSNPGSIDDGSSHQSLLATPTISWNASTDSGSGVSHYEVAIGTSAGGTNIKNWISMANNTSGLVGNLNLTANTSYYASVRAVDAAGNIGSVSQSDGWTATSSSINCPTGYVRIPANADLGTAEFCVMKYEAKNVGGIPTSQAAGTPWIQIALGTDGTSPNSAWKACKDLGNGYDLISNPQWQAIARNIESVASNWSNGSSGGSNFMNRGHSDINPGSALAASTDDDPCAGTGNPSCTTNSHADFSQKRTHSLSNGEIIWDIAGNAQEIVQQRPQLSSPDVSFSNFVPQLTFDPSDRLKLGPAGDHSAKGSPEYGGLGWGYWDNNNRIIRGGDFDDGNKSGVFAFDNLDDPFNTTLVNAFRCTHTGNP